jgi:hypothetical protein
MRLTLGALFDFEVVGDQAVIRPVVVVPLAEAERTAAAA